MTSLAVENENVFGLYPEAFLKCSRCSNSVNISDFENVSELSEAFKINENIDFIILNKKNGEVVSVSRENHMQKFEFSSFDLAESFYNSVQHKRDNSVPYVDRIHCLTFPELFGEKYLVSFYALEMMFYCQNCTFACSHCSDTWLNWNNAITTFRGQNICDDCYTDDYFTCENCDSVFSQERSQFVNDRSAYWCEGCCQDEATWCDYHDGFEMDMCDHNYEENDVDNWNSREYEGVYPWSFKPAKPDFYLGSLDTDNTKLTFGFELEVESEGESWRDGIKIVKESLGDFAYFKGDGSLNNGYEIVTFPFSFNYYLEGIDFSFLNKLKDLGYRSWTPETCGFHIHIARAGFSSAGHIWKFANLILQNPNSWQKLAGRGGQQWASYNLEQNPVMKVLKGESDPQRYVAVNMCNAETIEVRIFRGSLNETRIRSAIESVYCAMEYTRNLSVHQINNGGLNFESFVDWVFTGLSGLRSQIDSQGLDFLASGKKSFSAFETLLRKYDLIHRESIASEGGK